MSPTLQGLFGVVQGLGFIQGVQVFFNGFDEILLSGLTWGFMSYLGFRVQELGFRVSCFGNKSRQPFGHSADIPKCMPCAVKMHFPGQHPRPGRIHIHIHILQRGSFCPRFCTCLKINLGRGWMRKHWQVRRDRDHSMSLGEQSHLLLWSLIAHFSVDLALWFRCDTFGFV